MVGTQDYAADSVAYIDYLWSDVEGVKTKSGVAVGSTEEELLRLYPEDLYYLSCEEAFSDQVHGAYECVEGEHLEQLSPEFEFDEVYFWQPFKDNDSRDVTFYLKDGKVCAIEVVSPFELRHVYGFDRDAALQAAQERRNS